MDCKLEVAVLPVADVDRRKDFGDPDANTFTLQEITTPASRDDEARRDGRARDPHRPFASRHPQHQSDRMTARTIENRETEDPL